MQIKKLLIVSFLTITLPVLIKSSHSTRFNETETTDLFKKLHQDFARGKDILGDELKKGKINKEEFDKQLDDLRNKFNERKKQIKSTIPADKLHSLKKYEDLIKQNVENQTAEELPLQRVHLFSRETYDRPAFDKERKTIERNYEFQRELIDLFTQEPKTEREHLFMNAIKELKKDLKNKMYQLRMKYLEKGKETYDKDVEFRKEVAELKTEFQQIRDDLARTFLSPEKSTAAAAAASSDVFSSEFLSQQPIDEDIAGEIAESMHRATGGSESTLIDRPIHEAKKLPKLPPSKL